MRTINNHNVNYEVNKVSEINKNKRTANDRYIHMAEKYSGKPVTLYRADGTEYREDGYINLVNKYGTQKDTQEHYHYVPELIIPDEQLEQIYEGNGLFSKIIDAPAEEAIKHGFKLKSVKEEVNNFFIEALDELDWDETAISALTWMRLFGGSMVVMLINDGRGVDEPLDWKHIKSIDDMRLYDRSVIQPDYTTMFAYSHKDPFKTRGSRLGEPEYYHVYSKYGAFSVHESRCLVFRNGRLPEKCTNSIYEHWGIPEYLRIKRALRDTELAHSSGSKMLDKAVQPIYKMKDLAGVLATEEGENNVLKRLQAIDLARGMLDSIAIDAEGEDYHFETFTYTGVSDIINITCNLLSALTNIPQTILFGRSPAGMDATGNADLENWYNYIGRMQKKMVKSNLRYLLSIIAQAGVATGELEEVPKLDIEFNPLWSLSEIEQATLEQTKAATSQARASTAQIYVSMGAVDPSEVRKGLAGEDDFNIEEVIEEDYTDDDLFANMNQVQGGNSPDAAPAATKLPQDMTGEEKAEQAAQQQQSAITGTQAVQSVEDKKKVEETDNIDEGEVPESAYESPEHMGVGVIIVSQGRILNATRNNDTKHGQICGPGGHIEQGETAEQAAIRETQEEFGITPSQLIRLGYGPMERDTGLSPVVFLCTNYTGKVKCDEVEMIYPRFSTLKELEAMDAWLYKPFKYSIELMKSKLGFDIEEDNQTNLDTEDEDIQWITTETGTHIPLKDGTAVGGPLKGQDFSEAKSTANSTKAESTVKPTKRALYEGLSEKAKGYLKEYSGREYLILGSNHEETIKEIRDTIKSEEGFELIKSDDEGSDRLTAVNPNMSLEECAAITKIINGDTYEYDVKEHYIAACKKAGVAPKLHRDMPEIRGVLENADVTVRATPYNANYVLNDEDIVRYSATDKDINPSGYKAMQEANEAAISAMTKEQINALNDYTRQYGGGNYQDVNNYLNGTKTESGIAKKAAETVTAALDHEIGADCTLYRGVDISQVPFMTDDPKIVAAVKRIEKRNFKDAQKISEAFTGKVITSDVVTSTSIGSWGNYKNRPVLMVFKTPSDAKAVDLTKVSAYGGARDKFSQMFGSASSMEAEVAFKPSMKYRIDKVDFVYNTSSKKPFGQIVLTATVLTDKTSHGDSTDDDIDWITVNGTHVPLKDGEAVNGPLKGEDFSQAESEDNPTETADKPTGSKYASKFDYEQAKKKAKADIEPRLQEIHSKYDAKTKAIHDKYGSKIQQSVEIKMDNSLSDEVKAQKLKELNDKFEKCAEERAEMEDAYSKELQEADEAYRTTFEPDYEYKKIEGKHSLEDDVKRDVINPGAKSLFSIVGNCQRCALAFEMRRRGYDVTAADGYHDELGLAYNIQRTFAGGPDPLHISDGTDDEKTEQVCNQMKEWGNGARALISTTFDDYAHIYNLCNENGEIFVCDGQTGIIYSDKTSLEAGGRVNLNLDGAKFVRLQRVDNATPCIGILDYVKERNGGQ